MILSTNSIKHAAPTNIKNGTTDFAFLLSLPTSIPSIKNSSILNLNKNMDFKNKKKKITPAVNNAAARSRFFPDKYALIIMTNENARNKPYMRYRKNSPAECRKTKRSNGRWNIATTARAMI